LSPAPAVAEVGVAALLDHLRPTDEIELGVHEFTESLEALAALTADGERQLDNAQRIVNLLEGPASDPFLMGPLAVILARLGPDEPQVRRAADAMINVLADAQHHSDVADDIAIRGLSLLAPQLRDPGELMSDVLLLLRTPDRPKYVRGRLTRALAVLRRQLDFNEWKLACARSNHS
jgi:hypothetical protein